MVAYIVPASILLNRDLEISSPMGEREALQHMKALADQNQVSLLVLIRI